MSFCLKSDSSSTKEIILASWRYNLWIAAKRAIAVKSGYLDRRPLESVRALRKQVCHHSLLCPFRFAFIMSAYYYQVSLPKVKILSHKNFFLPFVRSRPCNGFICSLELCVYSPYCLSEAHSVQVIVVVLADWTVVCLNHNLQALWYTSVRVCSWFQMSNAVFIVYIQQSTPAAWLRSQAMHLADYSIQLGVSAVVFCSIM